MLVTHKTHQEYNVGSILMLSAWGFTMVIASFLFLYVGHLLDGILGTSPNFMLGLFFLAILIRESASLRFEVKGFSTRQCILCFRNSWAIL